MGDLVDLALFRRRRLLENSTTTSGSVLCNETLEDLTDLLDMIQPVDNIDSLDTLGICPNRLNYLACVAEDILSKLDELGYFEEEVIANDNELTEE